MLITYSRQVMVWWDLSDHRVKREFRKKIIKGYDSLGKTGTSSGSLEEYLLWEQVD